jgi:hypothetical protein
MSEEVKDGDVSEETKEFDASAFSSGIVESVENSTEDSSESSLDNEVKDSTEAANNQEDEDAAFNWSDNYSDSESSESKDESTDESTNESVDKSASVSEESDIVDNSSQAEVSTEDNNTSTTEVENTPVKSNSSLTDEHFSAFADELGINAKSMTELKEAMLKLEDDNKRLQENAGNNVTNKKITALQSYLKFDDKELLQKDLEAQGFKGEQLEEAMDTLQDNGMLKVEATKVRNAINSSIESERSAITQNARDEDARQLKEREESVKALNTYLSKQTEMFGFKMAKDEESLKKVRDSHHKYITNGNFLQDITKDNESLAESAWLWKNRETLLKAARNGGLQQGRSEILNDMHNPDTDKGGGFVSPDGKGEFNVNKFRGSSVKK